MHGVKKKVLKPKEYKKIINDLNIEHFEFRTSSYFEVKATLVHLLRLEEELLDIRRAISGDMRAIKLKYLDQFHAKPSLIGSFSFHKPNVGVRRKSLSEKCDHELGPYNNLIYIIDEYLKQIEDAKSYLNSIEA